MVDESDKDAYYVRSTRRDGGNDVTAMVLERGRGIERSHSEQIEDGL
jgi:hypothetical protein